MSERIFSKPANHPNPFPEVAHMRFATRVTALFLLSLAACGGGDDSLTGTNNGGNKNGGTGAMSATVAGASWSAPTAAGVYSQSVLSVAGIDLARGITISFAISATAPGTYSTAFNNSNGGIAIISNNSNQTWVTYTQGGTGSVVVTTLEAHRAVGTFAFTGVISSGTGTITVTNGKFDVTF
jgi:hypothetical protein